MSPITPVQKILNLYKTLDTNKNKVIEGDEYFKLLDEAHTKIDSRVCLHPPLMTVGHFTGILDYLDGNPDMKLEFKPIEILNNKNHPEYLKTKIFLFQLIELQLREPSVNAEYKKFLIELKKSLS